MTFPASRATVPVPSPLAPNALVATYPLGMFNATFRGHLFSILERRKVTALVFAGTVWALMLLVVSILAKSLQEKADAITTDRTSGEIANACDNSIAHTDWFLAQVIDTPDVADRISLAMFCASGRGVRLGEAALYLRGSPCFIPPETGTRIPMLVWMSGRFRDSLGLETGCMAKAALDPVSHDNPFSTAPGMLDVTTTAKDATLDLAGACRPVTG